MRSQWKSNLIVGIFVFAVLGIFMYFIMNYTNELGMFEPRAYVHTTFKQPVGLFDGAAVQLNNVKIGRISGMKFSEDITDNTVYVTMVVNVSDLPRIGKDAVAKISTVGLLGDNIINIEAGNPVEKGHIEAGDYIQSEEFGGLLGGLDIEGITLKLESILDKIDKDGIEAISGTFQNVEDITEKIKKGEGSIGKLIADEELFDELDATLVQLKRVVARINKGPGSVHTLIYKDDVGRVMHELKSIAANLDRVSGDINEMIGQIKDEDVAKKISEVADNLAATSDSLASIAKSIEDGEGTVGALIKDPTLYEDLKVILQGAKRSKALKYAVQHTIQVKQRAAEREKKDNPPPPAPQPLPTPEPGDASGGSR